MPHWLLPPRPKHRRAPGPLSRIRRTALAAVPVAALAATLLVGAPWSHGSSDTANVAAVRHQSRTAARSHMHCVWNHQGIPQFGAYVGAAVGGTEQLPQLERQTGRLGVHRTYYQAGQVDDAVRTARSDLLAGRTPWISFKMPYSWSAMAAGRGDAWVRGLADKLGRLPGPVWLAFHHEPEWDGNPLVWKRMQQHLAPIIHARTNNVAYTIILTGWDALFGPRQFHLSRMWPGDRYVDVLGMDVYNDFGTNRSGHSNIPMLNPMKYFRPISRFARAHHVKWAIAETGYSAPAVARNPSWLVTEYRDLRAEGGVALTYFDSSLNSIANWTLSSPPKVRAFHTILNQTRTRCLKR